MKKLFIISALAAGLLLSACAENKSAPQEEPDIQLVHMIPDSLRTPQQQELLVKLQKAVCKYLKAEDNRFKFDVSKEEFLQTGVPEIYWNVIQRTVKDHNEFIDKHPELQSLPQYKNLDSLVKTDLGQLLQKIESHR